MANQTPNSVVFPDASPDRALRGGVVVVQTSHVSWGTYADAMCFEGQLHCNAHANNMVVLAPNDPAPKPAVSEDDAEASGDDGAANAGVGHHFLSFLDLDMAFGADDYLDAYVGLTRRTTMIAITT